MSRPMNMLRTRRKDCNVKPNRRLDRKSSRGMIYENEELRLKTININAEVESRVSDIKKLKKENEMLKKGLWYLRDEYDKLEKIIKDKKLELSSSSTTGSTSSDSESYSSYSDDEEEVETTQNMKNVQRTNLKNLQDQFDHLSVVTEETSAENSELHSNRVSLNKESWTNCEDILQPDQSYPEYRGLAKSPTLPMSDNVPVNFFSPIKTSKSFDDRQVLDSKADIIYPGEYYNNEHFRNSAGELGHAVDANVINNERNSDNYLSQKVVKTNATNIFQNMVLVPKSTSNPEIEVKALEKSATDLIVKIDNQNFNDKSLVFSNTPSQSTFSNGGNLEELLNDIESISQKGSQHPKGPQYGYPDGFNFVQDKDEDDRAYRSELSVVLVPNPMPLIGFDKYKNVQRSFENLTSKPPDEALPPHLLASQLPQIPMEVLMGPMMGPAATIPEINNIQTQNPDLETNPFFFGNFKDNYVNADHFSMRYNPDLYKVENPDNVEKYSRNLKNENSQIQDADKLQKYGSKTNLLELTSSEHISSENEDHLKTKQVKSEKPEEKIVEKQENQQEPKVKSPKMSIRKKVSIHFKGKKEKNKLSYSSDSSIPKTPNERRGSLFDVRFNDKEKDKEKPRILHQKTPSMETQKSAADGPTEPKTPSSSDSKNSDKKSDKKESGSEKKSRKSVSVSPDRKQKNGKEDSQQSKKHKKHKKGDKNRKRQNSMDQRGGRERSYSICTDRSNILEHRLGLGPVFGSSLYFDEYSDRERTNSMSSCETAENRRKMSMLPNVALSGKVPWCACWGNGCL